MSNEAGVDKCWSVEQCRLADLVWAERRDHAAEQAEANHQYQLVWDSMFNAMTEWDH